MNFYKIIKIADKIYDVQRVLIKSRFINNVAKGTKIVAKGAGKVVSAGMKVSRASYIVNQTLELGGKISSKVIKDKSGSVKFGDNKPIREYEIITYQDFVKRSVVGDALEGHELWQHSNLKTNSLVGRRLSSEASKNNPIIALNSSKHKEINKLQNKYKLNCSNSVREYY